MKGTDKVKPKFHKGDWVVVSTTKGDRVVQIASVEYFKDGYPSYITTEGRWFGNGTKARLLTDKDVEITTIPESKIVVNNKYWSEEDERMLDNAISSINHESVIEGLKSRGISYSIDSSTHLMENLIDWLNSLKDRVQPKQEWSYEDRIHLGNCIALIQRASEREANWLKSLRPQNTWKPSDEQMVVLNDIIINGRQSNANKRILKSLQEQLKKLKE